MTQNFTWPGSGSGSYIADPALYDVNGSGSTTGSLGVGGVGAAYYPGKADNVGIHISWGYVAASATTFVDGEVDDVNDSIAETAHGYLTGLQGQLTTSGTLPAGLSTSTNYYVIKVDADNYKLAASRALADAGTAVDITSASGGGTHTFTPTAGGTIGEFIVQASNFPESDDIWTTLDLSSVISVDNDENTAIVSLNQIPYKAVRVGYTPTSGQGSYTIYMSAKEI